MGLLYDLIFGVFVLTALAATIGHHLDKTYNTSPVLSITFGIVAIIFGLIRLVVKSQEIYRKQTRNNADKDK